MRFQSKPRIIDAEQFFADKPLPFSKRGPYVAFKDGRFYVTTAHGQPAYLADGDWVIPEPSGPHVIAFAAYPVKPDIFANSYELVAAQAAPPTHPLSEGDTTGLGPLDRIRFLALVGDNTPSTMSKALRQIYHIACEASTPTPEAHLCGCGDDSNGHDGKCSTCRMEQFTKPVSDTGETPT